jgi:propionate CoA-transferase
MKIITSAQAASVIEDGWCIIPGGFGSCGHPDTLTSAIRNRFIECGKPKNLSLFFGAGPGNKTGSGIDALAIKGLVSKAIGGFWGLSPALSRMAMDGSIEAHNWPQGVISRMFSEIAGDTPGLFSKTGIGTFIDPDLDGGVICKGKYKSLIEKLRINGTEKLFYPSQEVNCVLLRGTSSDKNGNISYTEETSYMDALAQAQAVKKCGGLVIVQVKNIVDNGDILPRDVRVPGFLVDYVVVATKEEHPQTYGRHFNSDYTIGRNQSQAPQTQTQKIEKKIIAHRAALELLKHPAGNVNLGIGIPALIGAEAARMNISNFTLTVESGLVGGVPDEGLSFGASMNPQAVIEQSDLFRFYDSGGLDIAFLGFAEVDTNGSVNVSRFGTKFVGSGGFINISQSAKKIVFCGSLTAMGLKVEKINGKLRIKTEGSIKKFRKKVSHLTFNGKYASKAGKEVLYVSERAVFKLQDERIELIEITNGMDPEELQNSMDCDFQISPELKYMPDLDLII